MKKIYYVKINSKNDYSIVNDAIKCSVLHWENQEFINLLLNDKNPDLWLIKIDFEKLTASVVASVSGCAHVYSRVKGDTLHASEVKHLLLLRHNSFLDIIKQHDYLAKYYNYSCIETNEELTLTVKTLDDLVIPFYGSTVYYIKEEGAKKLKKALNKIESNDLKYLLIQTFYQFTHIEYWFCDEEFESYCLLHGVRFEKRVMQTRNFKW